MSMNKFSDDPMMEPEYHLGRVLGFANAVLDEFEMMERKIELLRTAITAFEQANKRKLAFIERTRT